MPLETSVQIDLPPDLKKIFFPPFQQGVGLEVEVGSSIKDLLIDQFGITADYLAERITTLFLNSKAIDDAATAVVQDGAVLALSGAMPGLVGATMRRGGHLAAMRGAMTYAQHGQDDGVRPGRIRLKLFNLLLEELGPVFLWHGVLLTRPQYRELLEGEGGSLLPRQELPGDDPSSSSQPYFVKLRASFGDQPL